MKIIKENNIKIRALMKKFNLNNNLEKTKINILEDNDFLVYLSIKKTKKHFDVFCFLENKKNNEKFEFEKWELHSENIDSFFDISLNEYLKILEKDPVNFLKKIWKTIYFRELNKNKKLAEIKLLEKKHIKTTKDIFFQFYNEKLREKRIKKYEKQVKNMNEGL